MSKLTSPEGTKMTHENFLLATLNLQYLIAMVVLNAVSRAI